MKIRAIGLIVVFHLGLISVRGAAPDWVRPYLGEDTSWSRSKANVLLVYSNHVKYLTTERTVCEVRMAKKITSEGGRADAEFSFTYNPDTEKVIYVRIWAISADGKTVKSFDRPDCVDQVAEVGGYFWNSRKELTFTGTQYVEAGGTFAWEVHKESEPGIFDVSWAFFDNYPVAHSDFEVTPAPGCRLEWHSTSSAIGAPVPGSLPGSLRWSVERLPTLPVDVPTRFLPNPLEVSVRCTNTAGRDERRALWEDMSRTVAGIIEPRAVPTSEIKAKAEEIVAGKKARWDRIRALTEFVQRDIYYLSMTLDKDNLAGYRPHPAEEVLKKRYGDCKDKATLLVTMLRAIGENGQVVLLYAGNPTVVLKDWPAATFNHAIVAIRADDSVPGWWPVVNAGRLGRVVIFDATDPVTPLGALPWEDQNGNALLVGHEDAGLIQLPVEDISHAGLNRRIDAELDNRGNLMVKVDDVYWGSRSASEYASRSYERTERYSRRLEERIHAANSLAQDVHWKDDWAPAEARWNLHYDFKIEKYFRKAGSGLVLVNPNVLPGRVRFPTWTADVPDGRCWFGEGNHREEVHITIPEGWTVEELPDAWTKESAGASCRLSYKVEGRELVYLCDQNRPAGFYDKAGYEALRVFYEKVYEAQRRPVILHVRPGAM